MFHLQKLFLEAEKYDKFSVSDLVTKTLDTMPAPGLNLLSVKPDRPKSLLWQHFGDCLNGSQAFCLICKNSKNEEIRVKVKDGSTGGMKSHLKAAHKKEYEEFLINEEKKREAVIEESSKVRKRPLNNNNVDSELEPKQPKLSNFIQKMTNYKVDAAV